MLIHLGRGVVKGGEGVVLTRVVSICSCLSFFKFHSVRVVNCLMLL